MIACVATVLELGRRSMGIPEPNEVVEQPVVDHVVGNRPNTEEPNPEPPAPSVAKAAVKAGIIKHTTCTAHDIKMGWC